MTAHPDTPENPMTDTDLAAAARIMAALADAIDAADPWVPANLFVLHDAVDVLRTEDGPDEHAIAAALLAAARRELAPTPRVWLPGDTVPTGVWVQDLDGELWLSGLVVLDEGPYVEVHTPSESAMAAAVAAEQARRAADELTQQAAEHGLYELDIPPCACGRAQPCRHCPDTGSEVAKCDGCCAVTPATESGPESPSPGSDEVRGYAGVIPAPKPGSGDLRGPESASERLRRAADAVVHDCVDPWGTPCGPHLPGGWRGPLAAWLRAEADVADVADALAVIEDAPSGSVRVHLSTQTEALALADAILGGEDR